jgi:hypothetical protein
VCAFVRLRLSVYCLPLAVCVVANTITQLEEHEYDSLSKEDRLAHLMSSVPVTPDVPNMPPKVNYEKEMSDKFDAFVAVRDTSGFRFTDTEFWKAHMTEYPEVYHVFCHVRSARPATAQLESVFNRAFLDGERSSSSDGTANNCMLIRTSPLSVKRENTVTRAVGKPGPKPHEVT